MKILYQLDLQDDQKFNASDFPDTIEILREGKNPFIIRPVSIQVQDMYARLDEAEELLKKALKGYDVVIRARVNMAINEYFDRYEQ